MPKALIVFATHAGETEKIADLIGEGLRMSGVEAVITNVKTIKSESALAGYDAYVFGAATYHGDMLETMKTFLFLAKKAELEGKVGAAFGAYGWSGEAPERIFGTMKNVFNMDMVKGPLMLKSSTLGGGIRMAHDYGREIAQKLNS